MRRRGEMSKNFDAEEKRREEEFKKF